MEILKLLKQKEDSLTDQVHKDLRLAILTGKIPAGARLVESTLAEEIGVSRTPVREALRRLVTEGLLYSIPRAGYLVEELSEHEIRDLFETRTAIEQVAARQALQHMTSEEMALMEENLRKQTEAIDAGVTEQMINLDTEFHGIIYRATRSKHLYRMCQSLSDHTLKFRIAAIHVPELAKRARDDHLKIYGAFKSNDREQAEAVIASHLRAVQEDVLRRLATLREKTFLT